MLCLTLPDIKLVLVTVLAFTFVPVSLACSIFGMNVQEINSWGHSIWRFILLVFGLFAVSVTLWRLCKKVSGRRAWMYTPRRIGQPSNATKGYDCLSNEHKQQYRAWQWMYFTGMISRSEFHERTYPLKRLRTRIATLLPRRRADAAEDIATTEVNASPNGFAL